MKYGSSIYHGAGYGHLNRRRSRPRRRNGWTALLMVVPVAALWLLPPGYITPFMAVTALIWFSHFYHGVARRGLPKVPTTPRQAAYTAVRYGQRRFTNSRFTGGN